MVSFEIIGHRTFGHRTTLNNQEPTTNNKLSGSPNGRNSTFTISLAYNLGLLAFFKYFNFLYTEIRSDLIELLDSNRTPQHPKHYPFGSISFTPFQTLSYSNLVYRGNSNLPKPYCLFYLRGLLPATGSRTDRAGIQLLLSSSKSGSFEYQRCSDGMECSIGDIFKENGKSRIIAPW